MNLIFLVLVLMLHILNADFLQEKILELLIISLVLLVYAIPTTSMVMSEGLETRLILFTY